MKKFIPFLMFFSFLFTISFSQEKPDTLWKVGGVGTLTFSQVSLYQWSAGGDPSVSGAGLLNLYANFNDGNKSWENTLDLAYGLNRIGRGDDAETKKTNDRIEFSSQFGMKASGKWYYSSLLNFKTQFTKGYDPDNEDVVISDFFAPAYITSSLGMEYKGDKGFQAFLSPITGKYTIVMNDSLSADGNFGVEPGKNFRAELGGFIKLSYKADLMENVSMTTKVDFFSNYLDQPGNIDVNFELLLAMKINEYLAATVNVLAIYDDDVNLVQEDGTQGPGIQVKEVFGLGLSYKF